MRENTGSKYNQNLSTKEIAVAIREDIKAAVKAGTIPAAKISVRTRHFAGGSAIDIEVVRVPEGVILITDEYVKHTLGPDRNHVFHGERHTPEAKKLVVTLKAISDAYNYDNSDAMTDHFDVNFYGHVQIDWELESRQEKAIAAKLTPALPEDLKALLQSFN